LISAEAIVIMKNSESFTLIELLIVMIIIGVLTALAIPKFLVGQESARVAEAKQILGSIRNMEFPYYCAYATYSDNFNSLAFDAGPGLSQTTYRNMNSKYWDFYFSFANSSDFQIIASRTPYSCPSDFAGRTIWMRNSTSGGTHPYATSAS